MAYNALPILIINEHFAISMFTTRVRKHMAFNMRPLGQFCVIHTLTFTFIESDCKRFMVEKKKN